MAEQIETTEDLNKYHIMATVTTGLEFIAADEIRDKLVGSQVFSNKKTIPGKVFFTLPNLNEETFQTVTKLVCIEHLHVVVGVTLFEDRFASNPNKKRKDSNGAPVKDAPAEEPKNTNNNNNETKQSTEETPEQQTSQTTSTTEQDAHKDSKKRKLKDIPNIFSDAQWDQAMQIWRQHSRFIRGVKNNAILATPIYRVTGRISGPHSFKSDVLAAQVAEGLSAKFPAWQMHTKSYEMEIIVYGRFSQMVLCINLNEKSQSLQLVDPKRNFSSTALRPAISYSLLKLADIKPGEVIVDPMAGCGTVPHMGAQTWPLAYYLAGDLSDVAIQKTSQNQKLLDESKKPHYCDTAQWDCRRLPFKDGSIDAIVSDMPFGKRMGSHQQNVKIYPAVLSDFFRVLNPQNGRAVLLTAEQKLVREYLNKRKDWKIKRHIVINQGGLDVTIFHIVPSSKMEANLNNDNNTTNNEEPTEAKAKVE